MKGKATIKIMLDPKDKSSTRLLKLRIIYRRVSHTYSVGSEIRITEDEFIKGTRKNAKEALEQADKAKSIATNIVAELGANFSFKEFKKKYREQLYGVHSDTSLFSTIADDYISGLSAKNTKSSYKTACRWVEKYQPKTKIADIDRDFIIGLENYIKTEGKKQGDTSENTIRMYLRNIRAIYNRGVQVLNLPNLKPFANIRMGSIRRQNAALELDELKRIKEYKTDEPIEKIGRDFFILTFALSGMNFRDILFLRNKDIDTTNNLVVFRREKTKETGISTAVPLTSNALILLKRYGSIDDNTPDDFILPYLKNCNTEQAIDNKIRGELKKVNKGLAKITANLGIRKITTYNARHTYASLAVNIGGLSREQLQKFLSHTSASTTENYLNSINKSSYNKNKDFIDEALSGASSEEV